MSFILRLFLLILANGLFAEELQFYSQYGQDKYLYENFFKDKQNGVFIDIGAYDGVTLSNTLFFEKYKGWSGICIEPIPDIFQKLQACRKCLCIEGCINDKHETVSFLKVTGYAEMLSGILENYDPRHLQRVMGEIKDKGGNMEVITVKCYPLTQLLLDNQITHIDFLSIDTEGGEMGILQSIDFNLFDIDIILVENNYGEPFNEFLEPLGYEKVISLGDEIYRKIKK